MMKTDGDCRPWSGLRSIASLKIERPSKDQFELVLTGLLPQVLSLFKTLNCHLTEQLNFQMKNEPNSMFSENTGLQINNAKHC